MNGVGSIKYDGQEEAKHVHYCTLLAARARNRFVPCICHGGRLGRITIGNRTNGATANAAADAWPAVQTKYLHDHNPRAANAFQEH